MKKILTVATAFVLVLSLTKAFAQVLPNPGFETWTTVASYEDPNNWTTGNQGSNQLGLGASVVKSTVFHSGSFAAQLQSVGTTFQFPGVICNGKITNVGVGQIAFSGGSPWTTRSSKLSGFYQYTAGGGIDSAFITVLLMKTNGTVKDTLAVGMKGLSTAAAYASFDVNMVYQDWSMNPDTILIIIQSSKNLLAAQAGTILLVDDLACSGSVPAGINPVAVSNSSVGTFPNPANNVVGFNFKNMNSATTLNIYDILGKKVKSVEITSAQLSVSVNELNNGMYFYQVADKNNTILSTGKLSVKK